MFKLLLFLLSNLIFFQYIYANSDTFYITKDCDIEHKKFKKNYDDYIHLIKNKQYYSGKRKFIDLTLSNSLVKIHCPYDITKYTTDLYYQMKSLNEGKFVSSQWGDTPLKKATSKYKISQKNTSRYKNLNSTEAEQDIVQITEADRKKILKEKYKSTPTIYIKDIIIYDVQEVSYFRNSMDKIMIKGKEKNYVFPIDILKEAKFENATNELKQKLDSIIKNK